MSESVRDRLLKHSYVQKTAIGVKRHRRWLYAVLTAFAVFGLLGYFWLPGFAKAKAESTLSELLHRPVTVQRVSINPYTLEATVYGFRIAEREGQGEAGASLLKFESLYINLSSSSIFRAAPIVSAVTLTSPEIHLSRDANGRLSIADLIEEAMQRPKSDETALFSVSNIRVDGGSIVFDDQIKQSRQRISEISLGVPFVASFASAEEVWVQPHFRARINDGSKVEIEGKARPFADRREMGLDIKLDALDLTGVDEYAPTHSGIKLLAGLLDTQLEVSFVQSDKNPAAIRVSGDITLRGLDMDNTAGLPWRMRGERLTLHLDDFDPMLKQPVVATLDAANLKLTQGTRPEMTIDKLSLGEARVDMNARTVAFALDSTINGKGHLKAKGNAAWAPVAAEVDIDADQVDFVALQGWAIEKFDRPSLALTKGAVSFVGHVKAGTAGEHAPLKVAVTGDAHISDFNLLDKATSEDLLRWRDLEIAGIDVKTAPLSVDIKTITQTDLFARITIMPDGSIRLRDALLQGEDDDKDAATQLAEPSAGKDVEKTRTGTVTTAPAPSVEKKEALPIRIGELQFKGGNVIFNDRFIKPNYRANLTQLAGKIGPLMPGQPGNIAIKGAVNRTAPLEISGKADPFGKEIFLDITAKAKGIELPGFSPYSSRYIGYEIAKGKLSVDLHYFIEKGQLRAENKIFLDQFTLGNKVESPNALSLPVGLAVTLLQNSRGEIDINLPISGSLDDPEFSIGGLIFKVFVNLIGKAITAPFALLGNMFGGGADLSYVEFAPGRARMTAEAEKNLEAVGKAMKEKSSLKLEIAGVATAAVDREELRRATMERRVKAQKLAEMAKQGKSGGSLRDVEVAPTEYAKYLELAYKAEKFDKPKNLIGLTKSLPVAEMEALMIANMPAGDDELRGLAERRAREAYEVLLEKGVPGERMFVVQPRIETALDGKKPGGRADFSLR